MRQLYARFLTRAAALLGEDGLLEAAARYQWLGLRWGALGEVALPTHVEPLARAKELLARRHMIYSALGGDGLAELATIAAELDALRTECDSRFPVDKGGQMEIFGAMQAELQGIYEDEVAANQLLRMLSL